MPWSRQVPRGAKRKWPGRSLEHSSGRARFRTLCGSAGWNGRPPGRTRCGADGWAPGRTSRPSTRARACACSWTAAGTKAGWRVVTRRWPTECAAGITARLPEVVLQYNSRRKTRQDGGAVFDERVLEMLHESVIARSHQGRVWITTFDETWSRFAPGICTLFAGIEFAASRGYAEYDLGIGDQAHKYGITDREVTLELVELERRGLWPLQSPFQLVPLRWRPALIAGVDRCLTQARTLRKRTASGSPG